MTQHTTIYMCDPETGATLNEPLAIVAVADPEHARKVIEADTSEDGRSAWLWVRLQNGDLMLACFPSGETYMGTEADPNRP